MSGAVAEAATDTLRIGAHEVSRRGRTFVIAEAGVNHNGSLERALAMVDAAAEAGADAVKFQMFTAGELATAAAGTASYQKSAGASQRDMLRRLELSPAEFRELRDRCTAREIAFLATPFALSDLERLLGLDPPAIKLASTDLDNVPLVRASAAAGLPLLISTGASTRGEIGAAVERLRERGALDRCVLLHCVSAYPTPLSRANLRAIGTLAAISGRPCGLSDHTTDVRTGAWAAAAGACVLEKHFTLDRSLPGPDHAMSLRPDDLAAYITQVREIETVLGDGALGMTEIEQEVRAVARKSVVAAVAIPRGAPLAAEMLAVKRPGGGIGPDRLDDLLGRVAAQDIAPDTALHWDMLA